MITCNVIFFLFQTIQWNSSESDNSKIKNKVFSGAIGVLVTHNTFFFFSLPYTEETKIKLPKLLSSV